MKGLYKKLILVFSLVSAKAFALSDEIFVLQDGDKVGSSLKSLFCELASSCSSDAFSEMIGILNYAILYFIGIVTCWFIFKAINAPAVDAKTGDGKFHWHVVRFMVGCAIVWPVVGSSGNYATANLFVFSIAEQGIAAGSYVARKGVSQSNIAKLSATSMMPPETLNLAHNVFLSSICMRGAEKILNVEDIYFNSTGGIKVVNMGFTESSSFTRNIIKFGNKLNGGFGIKDNECGEVSIPILQASNENSYKIAVKVHNKTINLIKNIDKIAIKFVDKPDYALYKEVMALSYAYQQEIKIDAFDIVKDEDKLKDLYKSIEKDGFLHLGAMTNRLTQVIHDTNKSINNIPVATGIPEITNKHIKEYLNSDYVKDINLIIEKFDAPYGSGVSGIAGNSDSSWASVIKDPTLLIKKIYSHVVYTNDVNDNIFIVMQKFGGWLMLASTGAFAAASGAMLSAGNLPLVSAGTSMLLGVLMMGFLVPMMGFAGLCLYVLPNIPTFIWYGGVVSYLISCGGAIIVASFIPATMILGGDAIMGQAVNAFKQLLSMFFKPILMVITYFFAIAVMNVVGQLILPTFFDVWNLSQDNSNVFTYIVSCLIFPFVYFSFMYFLITTVFKNTMNLSDQLISWMGGAHGFAINGGSAEFGSAGGSAGAAVTGAAAGAAAGGVADYAKNKGGSGGSSALNRLNNSMPKPANQQNQPSSGSSSASKGVGAPGSLSAARASSGGSGEADDVGSSSASFEDVQVPDADYSQQVQDFELGEKYDEAYQSLKEQKPNASHNEAAHYAMSSAVSNRFGAGSGKAVAAAGNGDFNHADSKMMLAMYRTAQENGFTRNDLKDISSKINDGGFKGEEAVKEFAISFGEKQGSK